MVLHGLSLRQDSSCEGIPSEPPSGHPRRISISLRISHHKKYKRCHSEKNRYTCPIEYLEIDLEKFLKAMEHIVYAFFPVMMQDIYICSASEEYSRVLS